MVYLYIADIFLIQNSAFFYNNKSVELFWFKKSKLCKIYVHNAQICTRHHLHVYCIVYVLVLVHICGKHWTVRCIYMYWYIFAGTLYCTVYIYAYIQYIYYTIYMYWYIFAGNTVLYRYIYVHTVHILYNIHVLAHIRGKHCSVQCINMYIQYIYYTVHVLAHICG